MTTTVPVNIFKYLFYTLFRLHSNRGHNNNKHVPTVEITKPNKQIKKKQKQKQKNTK